MGKTQICPVCEHPIPADVNDYCFYCGFSLSNAKNKKQVSKAKYNFCGKKKELELLPGSGTQKGPMPVIDLIIGIILGNACFIIILNALSPANLWSGFLIFLLCLFFGFGVGAIIYLLDFLIRNSFHEI